MTRIGREIWTALNCLVSDHGVYGLHRCRYDYGCSVLWRKLVDLVHDYDHGHALFDWSAKN